MSKEAKTPVGRIITELRAEADKARQADTHRLFKDIVVELEEKYHTLLSEYTESDMLCDKLRIERVDLIVERDTLKEEKDELLLWQTDTRKERDALKAEVKELRESLEAERGVLRQTEAQVERLEVMLYKDLGK